VQIDGRRVYLGKLGTAESKARYRRILADWFAIRDVRDLSEPKVVLPSLLTVSHLLLEYWRFAERYYCTDGVPTKELSSMRDALRPLRQLFGTTRVADFGPRALKSIQQHLVASGISRGVINARINRVRRMFKWAASEELERISKLEFAS
jgi:hypothetical protein